MKKKINSNLFKKSKADSISKNSENVLDKEHHLNKMLLDSLPHPAMLIHKNRKVLAANGIAKKIGVVMNDFCWKEFGKSLCLSDKNKKQAEQNPANPNIQCTFCMADDMFKNMKAQNDSAVYAFDRLFDTYWIPLNDEIYLHYAIDITERKQAEAELEKHREQLEVLVAERTKEVDTRNKELESMHKVFIGREFRIKELKDQVKELKVRLGE